MLSSGFMWGKGMGGTRPGDGREPEAGAACGSGPHVTVTGQPVLMRPKNLSTSTRRLSACVDTSPADVVTTAAAELVS